MRLQHVVADLNHIAVEKFYEVLAAHIKGAVSSVVVLVHLHAARAEELWDVSVAEESVRDLETSSTTESSQNVTEADNGITNYSVVIAKHLLGDRVDGKYLTWADAGAHELDTLTMEEFVHLFDFFTGTKDALVTPEVLKVITADPFACSLVFIGQSCLEAMVKRQMFLKLLPRNKSVIEQLELVLFFLKQVLKYHGSLRWSLRDQVEAHMVIIRARILVPEALLLTHRIDVAQGLAAR